MSEKYKKITKLIEFEKMFARLDLTEMDLAEMDFFDKSWIEVSFLWNVAHLKQLKFMF